MLNIEIKQINEKLKKEMKGKNIHALPQIKKVVINYRVPDARESQESLNNAITEITAITGQKPMLAKAKKSVATFKLRQGDPLALKVTLRGERMYDFIEKLFNIVLARLRDFKGMPQSSFDQAGNYNMVIKDQTIFPEINLDKVTKIRSVQVSINISSSSIEESKMLLSALGFPFEKQP